MKMNGIKMAVLAGVAALGCSGSLFAQNTAAQDKMFVKKASGGSLAEVELGKLAARKGQSDDVKQFGQKMVDDHSKLMGDMKPFADKMHLPPPTLSAAQKVEMTRLKARSGVAFDKEYVTYMDKDHHKDLADFTKEEGSTSNQDLKSTVSSGKQVIQEHTEMIDGIAKKMNIPTPSM
jgi:putative membrane protein